MVDWLIIVALQVALSMAAYYFGRMYEKKLVLHVLKHCMHQPKHLSFNSSGEMHKASHDVLGAFRKFYGGR